MTKQFSESLVIDGVYHRLNSFPLDRWLAKSRSAPRFTAPHTALWRGYRANWEIRDQRLYLVGITGFVADNPPEDDSEALGEYMESPALHLPDLFPEYPERVFAHWCSGDLCIPLGDPALPPTGYKMFDVYKGVITRQWSKENEP